MEILGAERLAVSTNPTCFATVFFTNGSGANDDFSGSPSTGDFALFRQL
jgi:hypothetical protein